MENVAAGKPCLGLGAILGNSESRVHDKINRNYVDDCTRVAFADSENARHHAERNAQDSEYRIGKACHRVFESCLNFKFALI